MTLLSFLIKRKTVQAPASGDVISENPPSEALNIDGDIDFDGANNGSLLLYANNDINVNADIFDSATGDGDLLNLTMTADSDTNGVGNVNIASGAIVNVGEATWGLLRMMSIFRDSFILQTGFMLHHETMEPSVWMVMPEQGRYPTSATVLVV